jgi:hypothetical protein
VSSHVSDRGVPCEPGLASARGRSGTSADRVRAKLALEHGDEVVHPRGKVIVVRNRCDESPCECSRAGILQKSSRFRQKGWHTPPGRRNGIQPSWC